MMKRNAAVAGFLIGLGVIINTLTTPPVLGAFLFSFGLLTIIDLKIPLFTGQIGFIAEKKKIDLFWILIFNFIGIAIAIGLFSLSNNTFLSILKEKAVFKFNKTLFQCFIDGFFCGTLIHFAVKCKKQLMTSMAIVIFILGGMEHCIADFPYLIVNFSWLNLLKFLLIVMGNSCGAIILENMLKKEGNLL